MIPVPSERQLDDLVSFLKNQFGLTADDDYKGLIPLALLLFPPAVELKTFLHNLLVIENQLMQYLDQLGADLQVAKNVVQNPIGGFAFGGPPL